MKTWYVLTMKTTSYRYGDYVRLQAEILASMQSPIAVSAICPSVLKKNCPGRDNSKSYQWIITKFYTKVEPIAAHMPITFGHSTGKNTLSSSKKPLKIAQNDQKVRLLFAIFPF